jgi:hypothetical protein
MIISRLGFFTLAKSFANLFAVSPRVKASQGYGMGRVIKTGGLSESWRGFDGEKISSRRGGLTCEIVLRNGPIWGNC